MIDEPNGQVVTATSPRDKCKGRGYAMDAGLSRRFTRTRYRAGYAIADVDAFIDKVEATLGIRPRYGPPVTAADVAAARFRLVRLRTGYDMREVDEALDAYEERLREQGW
jgi:DivIVA domain-containing protein